MKKQIIILLLIYLSGLTGFTQKHDWNNYVVEVATKQYHFFDKITEYINDTDISVTTPMGEDLFTDKIFSIYIYTLERNKKANNFEEHGHYIIVITSCHMYAKINYKFIINDFTFICTEDLNPYFTSCSINKKIAPESIIIMDGNTQWWTFEISYSQVINAFYECQEEGMNTERDLSVYNLRTKQLMTKKDFQKHYPYLN